MSQKFMSSQSRLGVILWLRLDTTFWNTQYNLFHLYPLLIFFRNLTYRTFTLYIYAVHLL